MEACLISSYVQVSSRLLKVSLPGLLPDTAEPNGPQVEHDLSACFAPLHARALQTLADHHLAACLRYAAADRQSLGTILRVPGVLPTLPQVLIRTPERFLTFSLQSLFVAVVRRRL